MKTKSNRIFLREKNLKYLTNTTFKLDPISLVLLGIFYIVFIYLNQRTVFEGDDFLNFFVLLFIVMATGGFLGGILFTTVDAYFVNGETKLQFFDFRKINVPQAIAMGAAFFLTVFFQSLANATLSITSLEQYLFYTFAAIAEEFFYRFFIATGVYLLCMKIFNSGANQKNKALAEAATLVLSTIIAVLVSSLYFFASHFARYGDQMNVLYMLFGLSVVWTTLYIYTKSMFASIIIHLIVNAIAFGSLLITI